MKKILEKIEKEIAEISKNNGYGDIQIEINNGKVCFIKPTKNIKI